MIVNVIPVSTIDSFDYFIYPEQHPANTNYFYNQVNQISQTLTDFGRQFMETSKQIYNKINDSEAIRLAKAALRYARGANHPNVIVALQDEESIRLAQPVMQRYIMACPEVRVMYHRQLIDGYSDTYRDLYPGKVGIHHYDWRRVNDSIIQDGKNAEGEYEWTAWQFSEELVPGDRELTTTEKFDVLVTWDVIKRYMQTGKEDLTNPFGGKVG